MQLGFITPKLSNKTQPGETDASLVQITEGVLGLSGRPYEITPNGYRLVNAEVAAGAARMLFTIFVSVSNSLSY